MSLAQFIKQHSLKRGAFTLASGGHSDYLIDLKMTTLHPIGIGLITAAIQELVRPDRYKIDAFGGMAVGGVPLVTAVCAANNTPPIPGFFVRKNTKGHGTNLLIDGWLRPYMRVVLLEDVITTGGSVLQAIGTVRRVGAEVMKVITVVDRLEGAAEALAEHRVPLESLLTVRDLGL
jgi:orotate phosphoribosyltransferase